MYHTLLEGVWLSDIGRMAEVRNVSHLAIVRKLRASKVRYISFQRNFIFSVKIYRSIDLKPRYIIIIDYLISYKEIVRRQDNFCFC